MLDEKNTNIQAPCDIRPRGFEQMYKMNECGIALGILHKAGKINRCRTKSQDLDQCASLSGFYEQNSGKV